RYQRVLAWQGLELGARPLPSPATGTVAGPPSPVL
ncbi:MAG TPA: lipoate--protein ligase, partial [Pseudomonas sp.]|nr:lipoate--protein ligase [Pseudomonas sp.]